MGPKGTMALLENLDQRETLDHVVSNGSWDSAGASSCCFYHEDMEVAGTELVQEEGKRML